MDKFKDKPRNFGSRWVSKADSSTPEDLVKSALAHRGWQVVRNFWVFDPETNDYGECDVVAVSGPGVVLVEVKRWQGEWVACDDNEKFRRWKKVGGLEDEKSPVWQVCRARDLLLRLIQRDFMGREVDLRAVTQTFVMMDPGKVVNRLEPAQTSVWDGLRVKVVDLPEFINLLPEANGNRVPEAVWNNLLDYAGHFRIKPDMTKVSKEVRTRKLQQLQMLWQTRARR